MISEKDALINSKLKHRRIKVATVGDSITEGVGASDVSVTSYPVLLQKKLGEGYIVKNFGVSGTTVLKNGDSPYVSTNKHQESINWNADILILMLGSNDSKPLNWAFKREFEKDFKDLINAYIKGNKKIKVFIATSPAVGGSGNFCITNEIVSKEVVKLQKLVAHELGICIIDVNNATHNIPGILNDDVHPNDQGYEIISDSIYCSIIAGF